MYIIIRPLGVVHNDLSLNVIPTDTTRLFKRLQRFIFSRKRNNTSRLFITNEVHITFNCYFFFQNLIFKANLIFFFFLYYNVCVR
jgi:hypothetical protein